jgi:hypothetical protein
MGRGRDGGRERLGHGQRGVREREREQERRGRAQREVCRLLAMLSARRCRVCL